MDLKTNRTDLTAIHAGKAISITAAEPGQYTVDAGLSFGPYDEVAYAGAGFRPTVTLKAGGEIVIAEDATDDELRHVIRNLAALLLSVEVKNRAMSDSG